MPHIPRTRRYRLGALAAAVGITAAGVAAFGALQGAASTPFALDVMVSNSAPFGASSAVSPPLSTSGADELLVAFVAADGPSRASSQTIAAVTGGGVTWSLAKRSNAQAGTAEVWTAYVTSKVTGARIRAAFAQTGFEGSISVAAFKGARATPGVSAAESGATGSPNVGLTTSVPGAWVWAVGNDWDNGIARVPMNGQSLGYQYVNAQIGNTFWVQNITSKITASGSYALVGDNYPTADRWDYAALEIDPAGNVAPSGGTTSTTSSPPPTTSTTPPPSVTTSTTGVPATSTSTTSITAPPPPAPAGGTCGLAQVALCETFDSPAGIGNRSGDLNGTLWGVSRLTGNQNLPSPANGWQATQLDDCGNTATVFAPHDVVICNGQAHDSVTDGDNVTTLAMYPKQPFDFANRTGRIVFDVSNDSQGIHAAWPELWLTDQPVPGPFAHDGTFLSLPRNGFGVRFAGCTDSSGNGTTCPGGSPQYVGVDSAIVVNNYVANDSNSGGSLKVVGLGAVRESAKGQTNHYEVDVSQNDIEVYGTDAFSPGNAVPPLRHIASIPNAGLTLSRGLIWIEDAHYNANKFNSQGTHTFTWDNVGFDGPVLPRDLAFDVLDNTASGNDLAYYVGPNASVSLVDHGLYDVANATAGLLTLNVYVQTAPITLNYSINGHAHSFAWPFPDSRMYTPLSMAVPLNLSELHDGDNVVTFSAGNYGMTVMNIDMIMVAAGGIVSP